MRKQSKVKHSDLYSPKEVGIILRNCGQTSQRALIEFLLESGCRIGEALSLKVSDIQFQKHMLSVTLDGKTGIRTVPLLKSNLPTFLFHLSTLDYGKVFPFPYVTVCKRITRMLKRIGLYKKGRCFHIFRHMKATHLLESGVPDLFIKEFLGWSGNSNMLSYYAHLNTKSLHDYFSKFYGFETKPTEPLYPEEELERIKEFIE